MTEVAAAPVGDKALHRMTEDATAPVGDKALHRMTEVAAAQIRRYECNSKKA